MSDPSKPFDPEERAREKEDSRAADAKALAAGEKSRADLQAENGHFSFRRVRISLRGAKPLE